MLDADKMAEAKMAKKETGRKYVLRGYVTERAPGRFVAVCLKPYLAVEGRTPGEAKHRLHSLIHAYLSDALKDGTLDLFMARRAPLACYGRYMWGQAQFILHSLNSVKPIKETCCVPQHG